MYIKSNNFKLYVLLIILWCLFYEFQIQKSIINLHLQVIPSTLRTHCAERSEDKITTLQHVKIKYSRAMYVLQRVVTKLLLIVCKYPERVPYYLRACGIILHQTILTIMVIKKICYLFLNFYKKCYNHSVCFYYQSFISKLWIRNLNYFIFNLNDFINMSVKIKQFILQY